MAKHRKCFKLNSHFFAGCWLLVDIKTQNIIMEMPWSEIYVCLLPLYGNFHSSGFCVLLLLLSWRKSLFRANKQQPENNLTRAKRCKKRNEFTKIFSPRYWLSTVVARTVYIAHPHRMLTKRQNSDFTVKTTFRYTRSVQRDAAALSTVEMCIYVATRAWNSNRSTFSDGKIDDRRLCFSNTVKQEVQKSIKTFFLVFASNISNSLSHSLRTIRHNIESWRGGGKSATFFLLLLLWKQQQHRNCRHSTLQRSINKLQNSNSLCCTLQPSPYVQAARERDSTKLIYSFVSVMNRNRFLHFSTRTEWPELNGWRWKMAVKLFSAFILKKSRANVENGENFAQSRVNCTWLSFWSFALRPKKKLESVSGVDNEWGEEAAAAWTLRR